MNCTTKNLKSIQTYSHLIWIELVTVSKFYFTTRYGVIENENIQIIQWMSRAPQINQQIGFGL